MATEKNLEALVLRKLCEKYSLQRAAGHAKALAKLNTSLENLDYKQALIALESINTECEFIDSNDTNFLDPIEALCLKADPIDNPDQWMNFFIKCLEKGFSERLHKIAHIKSIDYFSSAYKVLMTNFRQSDQARDRFVTLIASEVIRSSDLDDLKTRSRLEVMREIYCSWTPSLHLVNGLISNGKHEALVWLLSVSGYRKGDECAHEFVSLAVQAQRDEMACLLVETGFPYTHAVFNDAMSRPMMVRTQALMRHLQFDDAHSGCLTEGHLNCALMINRPGAL